MAKKKAAKQEPKPENRGSGTEDKRDFQRFSKGVPVETVEAKEPIPFVQPAPEPDPKTDAIAALNAEVNAIAAGRPLESVVYRFNKRNGTQTGSSLKYYLSCKLHEIENDVPCDFVSPAGPVQEPLAGMGGGTSKAQQKAKPKCPTC